MDVHTVVHSSALNLMVGSPCCWMQAASRLQTSLHCSLGAEEHELNKKNKMNRYVEIFIVLSSCEVVLIHNAAPWTEALGRPERPFLFFDKW